MMAGMAELTMGVCHVAEMSRRVLKCPLDVYFSPWQVWKELSKLGLF